MKKLTNNLHGFTLIETVVAMALLVIVIFSFVGLFTTSHTGIFSAGYKSEALYSAQKDLESIEPDPAAGENSKITFGTEEITVTGDIITVDKSYFNGSRTVSVTVFMPN